MAEFTKEELRFIGAVKRMEKRTEKTAAYIILSAGQYVGRVVVMFPSNGAARVHVVAWLPNEPGKPELWTRHHGWAGGGGYDKVSAAMSGGRVWDPRKSDFVSLPDGGQGWRGHLQDMGYEVIQAV